MVLIRRAMLDDLQQLQGISVRSFTAHWSKASFEAEFYKDFSYTYLYEIAKKAFGYIVVWALKDEGEIVTLAVDKGFRGHGIGTKLLTYAINKHSEVMKWSLEVEHNNLVAMRLYEKNRFIANRLIKDYYGQGQDAIQMCYKV